MIKQFSLLTPKKKKGRKKCLLHIINENNLLNERLAHWHWCNSPAQETQVLSTGLVLLYDGVGRLSHGQWQSLKFRGGVLEIIVYNFFL